MVIDALISGSNCPFGELGSQLHLTKRNFDGHAMGCVSGWTREDVAWDVASVFVREQPEGHGCCSLRTTGSDAPFPWVVGIAWPP